jgi:hypothetical protein
MPKLPIVVPVVPTPIHETNAHYAHSLHGWWLKEGEENEGEC